MIREVMSLSVSVSALLLYGIAGAAFLIYFPFLWVAYARFQGGMAYLETPRALSDQLPDYAKRANWAHQNSIEAFMLFAAAAGMAYATGVDSMVAGWAALVFLVARGLYSIFYIFNIPLGRSLMFGIGSLCNLTLFGLSFLQVSS
ncbi:MAPEG family protein [Roseofilum sp. BLCC_M91]|uniref:MAPEG family protein n=1 Tax=Roseofilum halophilum BLCC-M91 TaxID=3022259 RepID=A0ABT7BNQ4_9CYAN|nr:MAPEG family protein [Roseofilum halophilum]MDJ1180812.1 MAPEG family protein [Roseofilum halophilum BLCC-M91]